MLAFNVREDEAAAHIVFEALQDYVPFHILGKFAAYRVGITTADFGSWNRGHLPSMKQMAKDQMQRFIDGNPQLFYSLYPVPLHARTPSLWFENLPGDVCCKPYDPLLVLWLLEPSLFEHIPLRSPSGQVQHQLVGAGNGPNIHGIPHPEAVRAALVASVAAGVNRSGI
jgi:hypothetical protein